MSKNRRGFTLIELLIVIGLLGALTALVLPSLSADREEALGDVCNYNQAGTVRVLKQYHQLTGAYPNDMHSGLQSLDSSAMAMDGIPEAQADHMGTGTDICPSLYQLTAADVSSLNEAGITSVCYGTGLNMQVLSEGVSVTRAYNNSHYWYDDSGEDLVMTFDGVSLEGWETGDLNGDGQADEAQGVVLVFWIAPTTDWSANVAANKDWGHGDVELGIDMEGQCPIPAEDTDGGEVAFAYYMAYLKVYSDGSAAKLIGTTCPECGVLNP
jgi:prepilin-type N-terminal cleavage/methylation domain-containing protein